MTHRMLSNELTSLFYFRFIFFDLSVTSWQSQRGCKKASFLQPLKNAGRNPGIFEAVPVGFALDFFLEFR